MLSASGLMVGAQIIMAVLVVVIPLLVNAPQLYAGGLNSGGGGGGGGGGTGSGLNGGSGVVYIRYITSNTDNTLVETKFYSIGGANSGMVPIKRFKLIINRLSTKEILQYECE